MDLYTWSRLWPINKNLYSSAQHGCGQEDLPERWPIGVDGVRESRESMLSACPDDYDDDDDDENLIDI